MASDEIFHILGGFVLGAGAYQYYASSRVEKPSILNLFLSGVAGTLLVEIILHGSW